MEINKFFESGSSDWVRYSEYKAMANEDGDVYITPAPDATFSLYNPLHVAPQMIEDALNIGRLMVAKSVRKGVVGRKIIRFAKSYGLLGFMAYLPLNRNYFQRENVYLIRTHIVDAERMPTKDYMALFLPFKKEPVKLDSVSSLRPAEMTGRPISYDVVFSNAYSERLDWLTSYFEGLYTHFAASFYYGKTGDEYFNDECEDTIERFGNDGLAYCIKMRDGKPTLQWDFNSLKLALETIYSFYLTGENCPFRICKDCGKVFYTTSARAEFCETKCRNRHNVEQYRKRLKDRIEESVKREMTESTARKIQEQFTRISLDESEEPEEE